MHCTGAGQPHEFIGVQNQPSNMSGNYSHVQPMPIQPLHTGSSGFGNGISSVNAGPCVFFFKLSSINMKAINSICV